MKTINVRECYTETKRAYGNGLPSAIVLLKNWVLLEMLLSGELAELSKKKEPPMPPLTYPAIEDVSRALILGDVISFGPDTLKKIRASGAKVLRGRGEDILLKILNGTEGEVIAAASAWNAYLGTGFIAEFLEGRSIQDITMGMVSEASALPKLLTSGTLPIEAGRDAIRRILGEDVVKWIESLPVAMIFPDVHTAKSCSAVAFVSRGCPEWIQPITEEVAIWSNGDPRMSSRRGINDTNILYELFGEKVENIQKESGGYNPNTGGWDANSGRLIATNSAGAIPGLRVNDFGVLPPAITTGDGTWVGFFSEKALHYNEEQIRIPS